jgi:prepilin-type N-terminal cleavage/methylation domain-containing protein
VAHKPAGFTILELLIVIAICGLIAAVASRYVKHSSITLKADEWQCMQTQERDYTESVWTGKMSIERTGRRVECVEWLRRG